MCVVRRLDRPREQRILRRVDRANGRRLERRAPCIADRERSVRGRILAGDLCAKRRVREIEVMSEALEQRRVVLLRRVDRADGEPVSKHIPDKL